MKNKFLLSIVITTVVTSYSFADCNFTYINKSKHPITLQGYFLEKGDAKSDQAWVTVDPTRQVTQVRTGKRCNLIYQHSGQLATRIDLKNNSGYWIGNKGFLFVVPDKEFSHYTTDRALADDGQAITLSNGSKVGRKEVKVYICDSDINSDDCK